MIHAIATRVRRESDEGFVLVMALFFLVAMGLLIAGLLNFSLTNFSTTASLQDQRNQVYAAEGALYSAVQSIRGTANLGAENTACPTITTATNINGYPTRVRCSPQPGSGTTATNRPTYTLLALPASGSSDEGVSDSPTNGAGGGGADIYVGGNVASNGYIERTGNSASGGFWISGSAVARGSCIAKAGTLHSTPACATTSTDFTDPGYALPGGSAPSAAPSSVCVANAAKFFPGTYNSAPTAPAGCSGKTWWFSPGLYYFDFTGAGSHAWSLSGHTIVGGTPNTKNFDPTNAGVTTSMPGWCKTDRDLPPYAGVEWAFGGDTSLATGTGLLELCATPSTSGQEIAIFGVGGSGAGGVAPTTVNTSPTTKVTTGFSGATAPNALVIDGATADANPITKNTTAQVTLSAFGAISVPSGAVVTSAVLRIAHREGSTNPGTLSATVTSGSYTQSMDDSCSTDNLCQSSSAITTDTLDVTSAFQANANFTTGLSVVVQAAAQKKNNWAEFFDGAQLRVKYLPAGGYRAQAGCLVIANPDPASCDFLTNGTGQVFVQGTVYTPLTRVDITTGTADTVQFNRGIIARDIVAEIKPGNGSSHSFGLGEADRLVLLTVDVQINGTWTPRLQSLVSIKDSDFSTPGLKVTYLSWNDLR